MTLHLAQRGVIRPHGAAPLGELWRGAKLKRSLNVLNSTGFVVFEIYINVLNMKSHLPQRRGFITSLYPVVSFVNMILKILRTNKIKILLATCNF